MSGIPQGSILGPVLFIIFINDLPDWVKSNCKIFADDIKLYNESAKCIQLQNDINELQKWSAKWNLFFNVVDVECVSKDGMYTKAYRVTYKVTTSTEYTNQISGLRECAAGAICGVEMYLSQNE